MENGLGWPRLFFLLAWPVGNTASGKAILNAAVTGLMRQALSLAQEQER
jgi:hypothetical protein